MQGACIGISDGIYSSFILCITDLEYDPLLCDYKI